MLIALKLWENDGINTFSAAKNHSSASKNLIQFIRSHPVVFICRVSISDPVSQLFSPIFYFKVVGVVRYFYTMDSKNLEF